MNPGEGKVSGKQEHVRQAGGGEVGSRCSGEKEDKEDRNVHEEHGVNEQPEEQGGIKSKGERDRDDRSRDNRSGGTGDTGSL